MHAPLTSQANGFLYKLTSYIIWPGLLCAGLVGTYFAFQSLMPLLWFNIVYLSVVIAISLFERLMPYEKTWLLEDGETFNNLAHTLLSKGLVQIAAAISASFPMFLAGYVQPFFGRPTSVWPIQWPMLLQVIVGLVVAELGLYIAHRLAHEKLFLWRFHALHHSVMRLWVINTGRFHVIDSLFKVLLSQTPLYLLGAPLPVFLWISAVTAFIGLLTHCNIDVCTGLLDFILSTPRLHRWHHSKKLSEGNNNYGENLVLWDQLLGTYFNPPRPSSIDIGISGRVAKGFVSQLLQPFTTKGAKQILGKALPSHSAKITASSTESNSA